MSRHETVASLGDKMLEKAAFHYMTLPLPLRHPAMLGFCMGLRRACEHRGIRCTEADLYAFAERLWHRADELYTATDGRSGQA